MPLSYSVSLLITRYAKHAKFKKTHERKLELGLTNEEQLWDPLCGTIFIGTCSRDDGMLIGRS